MEELLKLEEFTTLGIEALSLGSTLFNFVICMLLAFVVRAFYINHSYSLTGKMHIASVMPILAGIIFLVIIIVKSSLALSLGLVGALSIVRFRTPIKEPEELVYLFLIIAIGLGFGAGYTLVTTIIVLAILAIIYFALSNKKVIKTNEYNLIVDWSQEQFKFDSLITLVSEYSNSVKLIRLDSNENLNTAVLLITPEVNSNVDELIEQIKLKDNSSNIAFFEAKTNW